jgi:hypothetical protein
MEERLTERAFRIVIVFVNKPRKGYTAWPR